MAVNVNLEDIKKIVDKLPNDTRDLGLALYREVEFMHGSLEELRKDIEEKGSLLTGIGSTGQKTTKANPSLQSYNAMIKNYSTVIRQITKLLDDSKGSRREASGSDAIKDILGM